MLNTCISIPLQCVLQLKVLISGFLNESNKAHSSIVIVVDRANFKAQGTSKVAESHIVNIVVTDKNTKESVIMANCSLDPLGSFNVTDIDGKAVFQKVPAGSFTLKVSYVGYETYTTTLKERKI